LIYGTEIQRGLDVLALLPSEFLSEAELAAAAMADQGGVFNPQQQFPVTWPAEPVVARAYVDQLERRGALSASQLSDLTGALDKATKQLASGGSNARLAAEMQALASGLSSQGAKALADSRFAALSNTLNGVAAKLR